MVLLFVLHPEDGILIIANVFVLQFKIAETINSGILTAALVNADQLFALVEPLGMKTHVHVTAQSKPVLVI